MRILAKNLGITSLPGGKFSVKKHRLFVPSYESVTLAAMISSGLTD
ncbi:hypothetical protein MHD_11150 [Mannheimia granulomatis]|uniref:Uncharacterized protein n=1 Tax=Mannheimia granulomatis TaxID=85402 RepID=A0A011MFG3_9PAST|nr:hypothetical protein AK33_00070 [Mannheimia granulomatis]RGE47226.1 hypothetical protein MHD_11150 [Mannheimia granulomatis]